MTRYFSHWISKVIEFFSIFQSIVATLALLATKYKADVPLLRPLLFILARLTSFDVSIPSKQMASVVENNFLHTWDGLTDGLIFPPSQTGASKKQSFKNYFGRKIATITRMVPLSGCAKKIRSILFYGCSMLIYRMDCREVFRIAMSLFRSAHQEVQLGPLATHWRWPALHVHRGRVFGLPVGWLPLWIWDDLFVRAQCQWRPRAMEAEKTNEKGTVVFRFSELSRFSGLQFGCSSDDRNGQTIS